MTVTVGDASEGRQPSPPTRRVVAVVEAVIEASISQPQRRSTLADIVRDTGLSRATTHAIVAELVDLGWLHRDEGGVISVGSGLLTTASRVLGGDRLTAAARPVLADLASTLRIPVFLARRVDAESGGAASAPSEEAPAVAVVEYAWPGVAPSSHPVLRVGQQLALRPPICREFIAWESPAVQESWVESAPVGERARLRQVLPEVAARGYSIERLADEQRAVIDALAAMSSVPSSLRHRVGALVSELTVVDYLPEELIGEVGAVTVGAPVFDEGRVVASIVACPDATMSADELSRIGAATVAAADLLRSGR